MSEQLFFRHPNREEDPTLESLRSGRARSGRWRGYGLEYFVENGGQGRGKGLKGVPLPPLKSAVKHANGRMGLLRDTSDPRAYRTLRSGGASRFLPGRRELIWENRLAIGGKSRRVTIRSVVMVPESHLFHPLH